MIFDWGIGKRILESLGIATPSSTSITPIQSTLLHPSGINNYRLTANKGSYTQTPSTTNIKKVSLIIFKNIFVYHLNEISLEAIREPIRTLQYRLQKNL